MRKKLLQIVLTLCMVVAMIPLFAGVAFAGEASITYTGPDGKSVEITASDISQEAGQEPKTFAKKAADEDVDLLEINISCPNLEKLYPVWITVKNLTGKLK